MRCEWKFDIQQKMDKDSDFTETLKKNILEMTIRYPLKFDYEMLELIKPVYGSSGINENQFLKEILASEERITVTMSKFK